MIFKETIDAAERVALNVAMGRDYHDCCAQEVTQLRRLKGCTATDVMRFSVEAQDKIFQLLRLYKAGYERLGGGSFSDMVVVETKALGGPDA